MRPVYPLLSYSRNDRFTSQLQISPAWWPHSASQAPTDAEGFALVWPLQCHIY